MLINVFVGLSFKYFKFEDTPDMSEDCLIVTLYIPVGDTSDYNNTSVVVHIHGGLKKIFKLKLIPKEIIKIF